MLAKIQNRGDPIQDETKFMGCIGLVVELLI